MHKFNGVEIRTPTSFSWNSKEIETEESGITQDGLDHSDVLAEKVTLKYDWKDPSISEVSAILTLVKQKRYVSIYYPDAVTGTYIEKDFKPTGKDAPFRELRVGARLYSVLSLTFEER